MKKYIITIILFITLIMNNYAQVPQGITFQAVARDAGGNVMINTTIDIQLSVIDSSNGGNIIYQEVRVLTTNSYGGFSFIIGQKPKYVTQGSFVAINWATGKNFIKLDYDPTNTLTFNLTLGIIGFYSVPYAFAANSVTYIDNTGAKDGDLLKFNGTTNKWEPGGSVPVGTILPFAGNGNVVPSGYLLCDGSAISRTGNYSALFKAIGNSYGAGDFTTTFNLPDLRGVFLRGVDGSAGNDPDNATRTALNAGGNTGNNVGSLQMDDFKSHNHPITDPGHNHKENICTGSTGTNTWTNAGPSSIWGSSGPSSYTTDPKTTGITINNSGGSSETRPKNVYVNYIIKY